MSRSRRHTPITGITKAEGDTRDQVLAHRRQRRRVRTALANGRVEVVMRRKAGDVWDVREGRQAVLRPGDVPSAHAQVRRPPMVADGRVSLTPKELAARWRLGKGTVYGMAHSGWLTYYQIGGAIRFLPDEIEVCETGRVQSPLSPTELRRETSPLNSPSV